MMVVSKTNAFTPLWANGSKLPWQPGEGGGTPRDGEGAASSRGAQVKAGAAKKHRNGFVSWCSSSDMASKPRKEEGTELKCNQAGFILKARQGQGAHERKAPAKQHEQACTPRCGSGFTLAGLFSAMPALFCHSATPCLQFPNFRDFSYLSGQVSCPH